MLKRIFAMILILTLAAFSAGAEEAPDGPRVTDVALELLGSNIHYPQLTGLADEKLQAAINDAIMQQGMIGERINRATRLMTGKVKLQVTYSHTLAGHVFSCAILADGAVTNTRPTQEWRTVNLDLTTGESIPFSALFTDEEAARAQIAFLLEEKVAQDLSSYLPAGDLLPLPECFALSPQGLTLYYPYHQFRTLSGKAGTVTFLWTELRDLLDLSEGSPLHALGVPDTITLDESDSREEIAAMLNQGGFPGIPATLGQNVRELTDRYAQLNDNELCEGGRMFYLEDGAFRQVYIITDALTDGWDESVVSTLRADRLNLDGLCTGHTTMDAWRSVLGEPDATAVTNDASAESWRIVPGVSDYYNLGSCRLRLHADKDGVLRTVFLMK